MEYHIATMGSLIGKHRESATVGDASDPARLAAARCFFNCIRIREVLEASDDFRGWAFHAWQLEEMIASW